MPPKLGVIAGGGELPARIVQACRVSGREVFVLALEGHTDADGIKDAPHAWARLGATEKALKVLRAANVEELVLAGPIRRPSLQTLKPDLRTMKILTRAARGALGDDGVLSSLVRELENEGFHVVGADNILVDLVAEEGVYGAIQPDEQAHIDIRRGIEVARALGALDVAQAAVVQEGIVLGVEAVEGTDALMKRCAALRREGPGGVLVKLKKPQQERRVDLPTIGVDTVTGAAETGLKGIAVEAGGTLILDRDAVVRRADDAGLFVAGVTVPE